MDKILNFKIFSFSAFILDFLEFINSHLDYHFRYRPILNDIAKGQIFELIKRKWQSHLPP